MNTSKIHERKDIMQTMTPKHPKWSEFYRGLCEWLDETSCEHTMSAVPGMLADCFGFTPEEVTASLEYFRANRAHCDCEVLLRFGVKAMDELARLREVVRGIEQRVTFLEREGRQEGLFTNQEHRN